MTEYTIEGIARLRLLWAKSLQKENEKLEAEVKRLREFQDKVMHIWMHSIGPNEFAQKMGSHLIKEHHRRKEEE